MLDAGFWILDFKKILFNYPPKDEIFDQHQASGIQHRFASTPEYVSQWPVGLKPNFALLLG
jgi:hypothetical protein